MNRPIMPASIAAPAANYAHAVLSTSPARWLHTSGVVPVAADGTTPATIAEQAATVWENIGAMLDEAAMTQTDIVSVTTYVVDGQPVAPVMDCRDQFLGGHLAASTLILVPRLAQAAWLMEVAIIAADHGSGDPSIGSNS